MDNSVLICSQGGTLAEKDVSSPVKCSSWIWAGIHSWGANGKTVNVWSFPHSATRNPFAWSNYKASFKRQVLGMSQERDKEKRGREGCMVSGPAWLQKLDLIQQRWGLHAIFMKRFVSYRDIYPWCCWAQMAKWDGKLGVEGQLSFMKGSQLGSRALLRVWIKVAAFRAEGSEQGGLDG